MAFVKLPTSEQVRAFRDKSHYSLSACRRIMTENAVSDAIACLKDKGADPDLIEVLDAMMDLITQREVGVSIVQPDKS